MKKVLMTAAAAGAMLAAGLLSTASFDAHAACKTPTNIEGNGLQLPPRDCDKEKTTGTTGLLSIFLEMFGFE